MKPPALHGLLVLEKPPGMTSRDAVDRAQRWFPRGTKIGHTGTLDPLATGVLVLCIGVATRLTEYVQAMPKTYQAGLLLGARSDTDDADGTITPFAVGHIPDRKAVAAALASFVGEIAQVPPAYSAAKVTGRRAYAMARRGQEVVLQPRPVTIYGIDILSYAYPHLDIEVRCGKGTYIRSLARDLGERLACGALIASLRRTRVGVFAVENAVPLDATAEEVRERLLPLEAALAELPKVVVDERQVRDLAQGRSVLLGAGFDPGKAAPDQQCALVSQQGRLIATATWDANGGRLIPGKVLATAGG
jgi:tRNA pseudouridine55 synthase